MASSNLSDRDLGDGSRDLVHRRVIGAGFWLTLCGVSLYLVGPTVLDTLDSAEEVRGIALGWLAAMAALQLLSNACLWDLQRIALRTRDVAAVATSQLAGNGLAKVAPGGGAMGAALQYRMLVQAGLPRASSASALTATNLLVFAVVLALPVLAVPAIAGGAVNHRLIQATLIGVLVFAGLFGVGVAMLAFDRPLLATGRAVQRVRNRIRRQSPPGTGFPGRLVAERDRILTTLGTRLEARPGRNGRALGVRLRHPAGRAGRGGVQPPPLAGAAGVLRGPGAGPDPVHPRRPGLRGGRPDGHAGAGRRLGAGRLVATFAYRLFSYWLMLPVGLGALGLHRLVLRRRDAAT